MNVVLWEINKTRFSKNTSPQIGENQNCPTWVRSPLYRQIPTKIPFRNLFTFLVPRFSDAGYYIK